MVAGGGWDQKPAAVGDLPGLIDSASVALREERFFDGYNILSDAFNCFAQTFDPPLGSAELGLLKCRPGEFLDMILQDEPRLDLGTLGQLYELQGETLAGLGSARGALALLAAAERAAPKRSDKAREEAAAKRRRVEAKLEKAPAQRTPVTVLTGFLGCGKTTLLNRILNDQHGRRVAVIENEFGEVGVDNQLVEGAVRRDQENIIEMNNGCICCTVRGDLIAGLKRLIKQARDAAKPLDLVLIETTGLADPAPVAQTFFADSFVQKHTRLDGILTIVDAKHVLQHLDEEKQEGVENEAVEQVAFADRILLNKCDLVDEKTLEEVERRLRRINKGAPMRRTVQSEVDLDFVLGLHAFDLDKTLEVDAGFLEDNQEHRHDDTVTSVGLDLAGEVDICKLNDWIDVLLKERGTDIFRAKGVLAVRDRPEKFVFQAVHMQFNSGPQAHWKEGEERRCRMVFIGRKLQREELVAGFMKCYEACEQPCAEAPLIDPKQGATGLT